MYQRSGLIFRYYSIYSPNASLKRAEQKLLSVCAICSVSEINTYFEMASLGSNLCRSGAYKSPAFRNYGVKVMKHICISNQRHDIYMY